MQREKETRVMMKTSRHPVYRSRPFEVTSNSGREAQEEQAVDDDDEKKKKQQDDDLKHFEHTLI